jgi:hypothetical protein
MGTDWGMGLGAGVKSGISTFGDVLQAIQAAREFKMQQQEQQAAQQANGTPTPVNGPGSQAGGQVVQSLQGGPDNKADPEAAFQGIQNVTNATTPQQAQAALSAAQQQGNAANAAATPNITQPDANAPPPAAPTASPLPANAQGAGGIGATQPATSGSGAPASYGGSAGADPNAVNSALAGINSIDTSNGTNWKPDPKSGAVGGIMPATWNQYAQPGEDRNNPQDVQAVQKRIMSNYAAKYNNDVGRMATAWFSGPGNVNPDPNAPTPYKNGDITDANKVSVQNYVSRATSVANRVGTVNSHGTNDANGNTPLTPDTKVQEITAKALPAGVVDSNYTFSKDAAGNVTMQKTATAADRAMAAANKAFQVGDLKNAGPLMQAAMTMHQQQAQQSVSNIMQNTDLSEDEKVGALAKLAGATAYKTDKGSYIVPGLGPADANGNPSPMNYQQVGALSQWMTTPEGMQHAIDFGTQQQQLQVSKQNAQSTATEAAAQQQNAKTNAAGEASREHLQNTEAEYYGSFKGAQTNEANAKAVDAQNKAAINQKIADVEAEMAKLNPSQPDYRQQMDHFMNLHNALVSTREGRPVDQNTNKGLPATMEPGKFYTDPNNPGSLVTPNVNTGEVMPVRLSQQVDALASQINASPVLKSTYGINTDGGTVGVVFNPAVAAEYGLNPKTKYPDIQTAQKAMVQSPKYSQHIMGIASDRPAPDANVGIGVPVTDAAYNSVP